MVTALTTTDSLASTDPGFADLQQALASFNKWRLAPRLANDPDPRAAEDVERELAHQRSELRYVEAERARVKRRAAEAPQDPDGFVAWFEALEASGPGQHDPLFDWIESDASLGELTWVLRQEVAGEAGFDDLLALTQVKMPTRVKLELARNYWDEMGQGHESGMHGPMLSRLADELGIGKPAVGDVVSAALGLGNLLVALALHRQYAYQSIGALGVIELTAPGRAAKMNAGLRRLGVAGAARRYFALHATLDRSHSAAWNREVLRPLVADDVRVAQSMAEGALMRLEAGARCFDAYRRHLGLPA